MVPAENPTGVSRRTFLRTSAAASAGLAAAVAGGPAAWAHSSARGLRVPASPRFDLDGPQHPLFVNKYLNQERTIMQSFAFDSVEGCVYVAQIVQTGTQLPGDQPGDDQWAERSKRGDLSMTKLDLAGNMLGHMYLKRFGHAVSIGLDRQGDTVHIWSEVDAVTEGDNGWGTRLTRFEFRDGEVIDAEAAPDLERRELIPGVDRTTCNIDPVHKTLVMRHRRDGQFRFALFDLEEVRQERSSYRPLAEAATPDALSGTVFQGYATFGRYLYLLDGRIYSDSNPPESKGNAHLTRVNWRTGEMERRVRTIAGHELHRREPEGLGILTAHPNRAQGARLCFGFGTSETADPADDRLCTIYYLDALGGR